MTLEPGLEAAFRCTATEADTAAAVGSGEVPVLATPRVLALAEQATVAAVAGALETGTTTVGVRVEGGDVGAGTVHNFRMTASGRIWPSSMTSGRARGAT